MKTIVLACAAMAVMAAGNASAVEIADAETLGPIAYNPQRGRSPVPVHVRASR